MSMFPSGSQDSPRRRNRTQRLYEARSLPTESYEEAEEASEGFSPYPAQASGGATGDQAAYAPNEPEAEAWAAAGVDAAEPTGYAPSEPEEARYYRRPSPGEAEDVAQPMYAPPTHLNAYGSAYDDQGMDGEDEAQPGDAYSQGNYYRPRAANWAQPDLGDQEPHQGYQVAEEAEEPPPVQRRLRKRRVRRWVALGGVVALLGAAGYFFRDSLPQWIGVLTGQTVQTTAPSAAISTPAPARGYDGATPLKLSSKTGKAITDLCGALVMEPYLITQDSVMARNLRPDGAYDYYLFSAAEGRLLAYFEGMGERSVFPLPGGGFYMEQAPYLVADSGSAMLRTEGIEQMIGEKTALSPMMNGCAIIRNESGTRFNYINQSGTLLSRLWFAKAYPMTGETTVAYVDTGKLDDPEARYALYIVSADGSAPVKWRDAGDMAGVVASAGDMAYLNTGELYNLQAPDEPLLTTDDVSFYVDCDAMVARDAASGKYGLYVHGERHYDFVYDSIAPVPCEMLWAKHNYQGGGGTAALYHVTNATYPQPLSHYFRLLRDGREEFVALSTSSVCPVLLDEPAKGGE